MTVTHEEPYDAGDALSLAITDTPVPEGARGDERFLAEHAAAVADVALLREQLRIVGDALAQRTEQAGEGAPAAVTPDVGRPAPKPQRRPGPGPEPGPPSRPAPTAVLPPAAPFRPPGAARRRAVLALAAVLGAGLLGGVVWLGVESGTGDGAGDDAGAAKGAPSRTEDRESGPAARKPGGAADGRSPEGAVACMRLIVEGTVRGVELLPDGTRDRITLDVSRYYKPAKGAKKITFVMDVDVDPRLRTGDRVLLGFDKGEATPGLWSTGKRLAKDREWIEKALPGSRGLTC
ncbi:hypothetical protein GCM10010252_13890 [Streptomyces aureoverticillatus]|nr:hypothetical protein GCM10010252_13890 [Streptomyces aureoverticillatus]